MWHLKLMYRVGACFSCKGQKNSEQFKKKKNRKFIGSRKQFQSDKQTSDRHSYVHTHVHIYADMHMSMGMVLAGYDSMTLATG